MASFTCMTCRVAFAEADHQRAHYKTDWHRYNLKRKVVDLPPVSAENFQQKALAQQAKSQDASSGGHCDVCNKNFTSKNSFANHLKSKRHLDTVSKKTSCAAKSVTTTEAGVSVNRRSDKEASALHEDDDSDAESCESWIGEPLSTNECLFCPHTSCSLERNVEHMTTSHSFFLPDAEYLVDLEGLLTYLGEKVGAMNMCLWCCESGRTFYTTDAVRRHMVDKGHCKMKHEGDTLLEYADFYDYRSSYPDYVEGEGDEEDEGQEEEEGVNDEEEEVEIEQLDGDDYEMVLPSGATIGHRSLARYYRQNLKPSCRTAQRQGAISNVLAQYRALGWTGTTGVVAQRKAKDIAYVRRERNRHYTQLGVKANKLHMKYFRSQIFSFA